MKPLGTLFLFATVFFFNSCFPPKKSVSLDAQHLHHWNELLEAAIVTDFFPPPVAGRIYTYPNISTYEILNQSNQRSSSFAQHYPELSIPPTSEEVNLEIAAIYAFYYTSIELVYSIEKLEDGLIKFEKEMIQEGFSDEELTLSKTYGQQVAQCVLQWAKKDGYNKMRSYDEYTPLQDTGKWIPTPPDYSPALEPYWSKIRAFTLDSASQFQPDAPTPYLLDSTSAFFQETMEVYEALNNNTEETVAIAKFWDCNPLVRKHQGHVTFAEKKLTPGGHWINIGRSAMKKQKTNLIETAHIYTLLSVGIHEAFISCWDEKYRSNYIRPVTVIQEFIDPEWTPILYTPNFPEYPSGHSVVSGSAATILTHFFGDSYSFTDSTEVPYGIAPRSFDSFYAASDEAAISRLFGGIHFMPAIENGKIQGRLVGKHVLKTLQLKETNE